MRLSTHHRQLLAQHLTQALGPACELRVFGSRTDDLRRGGDVDIVAISPHPIERPVLTAARLEAQAERLLGGRRVDVLLIDPLTPRLPIHEIALQTSVPL